MYVTITARAIHAWSVTPNKGPGFVAVPIAILFANFSSVSPKAHRFINSFRTRDGFPLRVPMTCFFTSPCSIGAHGRRCCFAMPRNSPIQ